MDWFAQNHSMAALQVTVGRTTFAVAAFVSVIGLFLEVRVGAGVETTPVASPVVWVDANVCVGCHRADNCNVGLCVPVCRDGVAALLEVTS